MPTPNTPRATEPRAATPRAEEPEPEPEPIIANEVEEYAREASNSNEIDPNEIDPNEIDPNEIDPNEVSINDLGDIENPNEANSELASLITNKELFKDKVAFLPAINIPETLYDNIKLKLNILSTRDKIIQVKLAKYQKKHEYLQMTVIVLSTLLSIYEAFRVKIEDVIKTEIIDTGIGIIPITLSGLITCTASFIKLKKYHEKSDQIQLTREKVSVARAKLKTVQEHLLFCKTDEELHKIKKIYFNNAFGFYCEGNENLDKYVKEIDYKRYASKVKYSDEMDKQSENKRKSKGIQCSDIQ